MTQTYATCEEVNTAYKSSEDTDLVLATYFKV